MCESIFLSFWGLWGKDHSIHPASGLQGRKTHPEQWLREAAALAHGRQRQQVSGVLGSPRESWPPAAGVPPPGPAACRPPGQGEGDLQPEPAESPHNCARLGFPTYPHAGLQDTGRGDVPAKWGAKRCQESGLRCCSQQRVSTKANLLALI